MPIRGLLVGAIILAVLAGLVFWSDRTKTNGAGGITPGEAATEVLTLNETDVQRWEVTIPGQSTAVIERKGSGPWEMKSPEPLRVDQEAANAVTAALSKVTAQQIVEEKAINLTEFGLNEPKTDLRVTLKDGKTRRLLLGDETPTGGGVFAKLEDSPRVFTLASAVRDTLAKGPQDLRDKRLLTFDAEKLTSLSVSRAAGEIEFVRDARKEWQIVKPQNVRADNLQVGELIRNLQEARMSMAASGDDPAKNAAAFRNFPLVGAATSVDASGTQRLEVRRNPKENTFYAKSSIVEGVHLVPEDLGKALAKGLDDFRNKKLFDFGFNQPGRVEVNEGVSRFVFDKQEKAEDWFSRSGATQGKKMDTVGIQSLIDKLRDLTATGFAAGGFGLPVAAEFQVTSDAGKRTEKVQVSRSGSSILAKRENEPAIYEIDAKIFDELLRAVKDVKPAEAQAARK